VATLPVEALTAPDIFDQMLAIKRSNCPSWTDESPSDFGVQLLHLFSVQMRWLADVVNAAKRDCYLGTTLNRTTARELCSYISYQFGEASAASALVTFTCESGHPEFTILQGTQVATTPASGVPAIVFETSADQLVTVGTDSVNITCVQGESISQEVVGHSDGTILQEFSLARKPVIWQTESVKVYDGAWVNWTRVDNFIDSLPTDKHYTIAVEENGTYRICFGDGVTGVIPPRGDIRVSYRRGGGVTGNIGSGQITELVSSVLYVETVNNANAASGGQERESLENARLYAPASIRTLDRAITAQDVEAIANIFSSATHGAIAVSKAFASGYIVKVMIVPRAGGLPSSGLKSALQTYLDDRRSVCTAVQVVDPVYVTVNITANLYTLPNYAASAVVNDVRNRLVSYISPAYQDPETGLYPHTFGRNIYLSDIYRIIDATPGVDHCSIDLPTGDTSVPEYKIATMGTLTLNATTPTDQFSFQDLSTEIKDVMPTRRRAV
jgi:hypothetical protein